MCKKIWFLSVILSSITIASSAYAENVIENEKKPLGNFVTIPGGTYEIGSPDSETHRRLDERRHSIKLSPYEIGEAGVTQEQYARITGTNPSKFKDPKDCPGSFKIILISNKKIPVCSDYPVENVNWDDATEYARLVSDNDPKYIYQLPTEAQQEVAFRGGTSTTFVSGNGESGVGDYFWYNVNSDKQTHPVKSKRPNAFGIYRNSVWEWANDWYDKDYKGSDGLDPKGPQIGSRRVLRGGGWSRDADHSRSARRAHDIQELRNGIGSLGFRLVRIPRNSITKEDFGKSVGKFVTIPGGIYKIGSPDTEPDRQPDEYLHSVKLSSYDIGEVAVTQERYARVTGTNPSTFKNPKDCPESFKIIQIGKKKIPVCADYPVENVNWDDANRYTNLESKLDSKFIYGLPTEEQLETAFRGGTNTPYVSGTDELGIGDYIWFSISDYYEKQTHPVKSKRPNALGIYRSGVWEWASGWYSKDYQGSVGLDPKGPITGSRRVLRGCSRSNTPEDCRSAFRNDLSPNEKRDYGLVGLRLLRIPRIKHG